MLVLGSTEKSYAKPPSDARRAFENKLQKRWEAMQKKDPLILQRKPSTVEVGQMSMVARDRAKIEHVLDRCWDFFIAWCKTSERYKKLYRNGEPSAEEISLQRDCFRNGSVAHKTISQWRRNTEVFVMHQKLLQRDPFSLDTWLVAAYVKQCKDATKTGAYVAFATLKWLYKCCGTPKWHEEPMVLAQIKTNSLKDVVLPKVKEGLMPTTEMVFFLNNAQAKGMVDPSLRRSSLVSSA